MSLTREEVVNAYLKDPGSVERRIGNRWCLAQWEDFDPDITVLNENWRLTPRPTVPGDLTWEEAEAAIRAGKPVQWFSRAHEKWFLKTSPITHPRFAYRLAPVPKLVPLGPEDVDLHHDLFRHSTVGPVEDQTIATRKNEKHIFVYDAPVTWEMAMRVLEWSRDAGKSWRSCSKEVAS